MLVRDDTLCDGMRGEKKRPCGMQMGPTLAVVAYKLTHIQLDPQEGEFFRADDLRRFGSS